MIEYYLLILFNSDFQMAVIPFRNYELCVEVLYHLTFEKPNEYGQCGLQQKVPYFDVPPPRPNDLLGLEL